MLSYTGDADQLGTALYTDEVPAKWFCSDMYTYICTIYILCRVVICTFNRPLPELSWPLTFLSWVISLWCYPVRKSLMVSTVMATARQWSIEIIATYIIMWLHAGKGDCEVPPTPSLPLQVRWPLTSPLRTTRECTPSPYLGRLLWSVNWSSVPMMYVTLYFFVVLHFQLPHAMFVCVCGCVQLSGVSISFPAYVGWHGPFEQQCMPV